MNFRNEEKMVYAVSQHQRVKEACLSLKEVEPMTDEDKKLNDKDLLEK